MNYKNFSRWIESYQEMLVAVNNKNMNYKNFCRYVEKYEEMIISVHASDVYQAKNHTARISFIYWYHHIEL